MPLAALITAQDHTDVGEGLRATLPLAGRTLIEYQAELAIEVGAGHVVVLVERVPASLAQAVDRLRGRGTKVEIARSVADATDRFHPEERILLVADGAIAAPAAVEALAAEQGLALLALPDTQEHAEFERIDATHRWAGFALFSKAALEVTVRMLGDWDLSSTLLRRLVQSDAVRIDALHPAGEAVPAPVLASGPEAIGAVEASLMRRADSVEGNWTERHLHRLLAGPLIGPIIARQIERWQIGVGSLVLAFAAVLFAASKLFWGAALLLPLSAVVASAARRMGQIWRGAGQQTMLFDLPRYAAALAVLLLLTRALAEEGGWGWWMVAAMAPAALGGLAGLEPIVTAIRPAATPRWLASPDALVWTAPAMAVLGGWRWMVAGLAAYATISFLERFMVAWNGARNCGK